MPGRASGRWLASVLAAAAATAAGPARAFDAAAAGCVVDLAAQKLLRADARLGNVPGAYPKATRSRLV